MQRGYECASCGVVSKQADSLCKPRDLSVACDDLSHGAAPPVLCPPARSQVVESCEACGRPALSDGMLCMPKTYVG